MKQQFSSNCVLVLFLLVSTLVSVQQSAQGQERLAAASTPEDVLDLPIEDLLNVNITSVSKKPQALSDAAAAIFVISHDDIKRSGVTSVPEALRMAPGVDVARINSNKWAVSARGFNGAFANKLLVLMDGRSVYTPAFSGVYWDAQDVLLEDVDRIEVIRGPGATLWGANAVNGVINIITKHTEQTQGGLLVAGGGSKENGFGALRYGKQLGEDSYMRAYAKGFDRGAFATSSGSGAGDDWYKEQGGFRVDSRLSSHDDVTLQGDLYQGENNQRLLMPTLAAPYTQLLGDTVKTSGGNLLSRWQHSASLTEQYSLQFYYDHYLREELFAQEARDTLDVDFQHNFALTDRQNAIWGLNYRYTHDDIKNNVYLTVNPNSLNYQLFSGFAQDELMLINDTLWFTLGSKFEHNDYTGFEWQPTARFMWAPRAGQRVWTSVSRAVRTPSRAENDMDLYLKTLTTTKLGLPFDVPVAVHLLGDSSYKAEELIAYEVGYRLSFMEKWSVDLTAFYNDYNRLRSGSVATPSLVGIFPNISINQPVFFSNLSSGNTYGVEIASTWQVMNGWRWDANYSFLTTHININTYDVNQGASPEHKVSLRTEFTPLKDINVDFWLRYVSAAKAFNPILGRDSNAIPGYLTLDARLSWKPLPPLELSVTGQNLLDNDHLEYINNIFGMPTEIPRAIYGKVVWQF
jgi:iron complex outermembrane receptor protein